MFVGLHVLLAERTMTPELAISEDEGKQFMASVQNVMRHYSVQTTQKTLDWIALMGTATGMYAPRIVAMNIRKRAARNGRPQPAPMNRTAPAKANGAAPMQSDHVAIVPDQFSQTGFSEVD